MGQEFLVKYAFALGAIVAILISWAILSIIHHISFKRKKRISSESADSIASGAIEFARMKARIALGMALATPIVLGAGCVVALMADKVYTGNEVIVAFAVGGAVLWCYSILRWRLSVNRFKETNWHYTAKKMVDEAVAPLTQRGHLIFRNFSADGLSVDHLIVGPKGIFALQTLVRPVSVKPNQPHDTMVTYDGRTLFFPNGKEHLSVDQATSCAETLSQWLSERIDAPVAARAIIALPGWQIKRISAEGISVINPSQMEALFQYIKARPLSNSVIEQIADQIEQHVKKTRSQRQDTPSDQTMTCGS